MRDHDAEQMDIAMRVKAIHDEAVELLPYARAGKIGAGDEHDLSETEIFLRRLCQIIRNPNLVGPFDD